MKCLRYIFVIPMLICIVTGSAFANGDLKPILPKTLMISFSEGSRNLAANDGLLVSICEGVGKKLTTGTGVFGLGVFSAINCASEVQPSDGDIFWLKVRSDGKKVFFTIGMVTLGNPFLKLAEVSVKNSKFFPSAMNSDVVTGLIAYGLLDQMPFQVAYHGTKPTPVKHILNDDEVVMLKKGVRVPELLNAFAADADKNGLIYPKSIGKISTGKVKASKSYLHAIEKFNDIEWRLKSALTKLPEVFFGLQKAGRSAAKKSIKKILDVEVKAVYEELNQNFVSKSGRAVSSVMRSLGSSGYLGLRYGPALLEGDLIDQSKYFGALVEFRSGLFGGLRLYHDLLPEVSGTINGQSGTFGGNRTIVAYSFSMSFDWLIKKIDLTPKVGVWNFRSKTPIEIEPGVYVSPEFVVKSAPSFDIELGLESGSSYHILRGWASNGSSLFAKDSAEISSARVGLDLLLSPWGQGAPVTVSLLSFFFYETVVLKKSQKIVGEGAELDELNYSQGYAGGGLAISW